MGKGTKEDFSIDISKVKDSFTWFLNMNEFLKDTELKCKDCSEYPCYRYPNPEQKIGFCYVEKNENTTKRA